MKTIPAVANISDAMGQLGLKFQTMHSRVRPVFTPIYLSGHAYTVQCYPGATWAVEEAIEKAKPGEVLVVNGENYAGAVLMGELMSGRAAKRGIAGAVIDGAVRDTVTQWKFASRKLNPIVPLLAR
ncbi:MAG: RraA family protein [Verrucomicrobiae bacterium]|nr:RraA family protein [Verrucomicrobiae bacterium]